MHNPELGLSLQYLQIGSASGLEDTGFFPVNRLLEYAIFN